MASPMGPPGLPGLGYSLRVQLFAANSHAAGDRPIRCFRVVTTPDVTIRDFCQEASRIHEMNYGEPIAIKKVQDDQEFDITQSEVIGNLFATASTIRVIQAAANPTIRDSVPPNSALRFEPSRKREREGIVRPNGETLASSWKTNKRQRVDSDPDLPLPSREGELVGPGTNRHKSDAIIPNSQEKIILGETKDTSRHVRKAVHRIPETPEPSLPPTLHDPIYFENGIADKQGLKSTMPSLKDVLNPASPFKNSQVQPQVPNPAKAKTASYHIPRSTERGTSVSTAATSPQSVDQQAPKQNGVNSASKRKTQDPSPKSNGRQHRSLNEESTYENIISDDEESALTRMKQAALKIRNSPKSGLQGLEWAKDRLSTPPNGNRRTSRSRDEVSSHNELPLTPNSKEREEKQRQRREADEARKARLAAAEAAEQRKREAEEARLAEEERARREEQERLEIEDFQRGEAERQAAIAKAARLQQEREAREKREAEERRLEETRIAREKAESQRLAREKAAAEEAKRVQKEEERREKEMIAKESKQLHEEEAGKEKGRVEALKSKIASSPPESLRYLKSSSPILPPSTTKLIPTGRKSALKTSLSSSQAVASSPAVSRLSPEITFNGVSIEQQMPLPKAKRVSFTAETAETPIKPSTSRILPPKLTAKAPLTKPVVSGQNSTPKPPPKTTAVLPPGRQSITPIPLPQSVLKRQSLERSITPTIPTKAVPPQKKPFAQEAAKKISPPAKITATKIETPAVPTKKQPRPLEISSDESGSDEDIPSRVAPAKSAQRMRLSTRSRSPASKAIPEPEPSDEEDEESEDDEKKNQVPVAENEQAIDENEAQSQNSSTRDSRSPVVFSQHAQATVSLKRKRSASLGSESGSLEDDDDEESSESGSGSDEVKDEEDPIKSKANAKGQAVKSRQALENNDEGQSDDEDEEESTASDSESEDQGSAVQVPKSSPPTLPPSKRAATGSGPKPNQVKRKDPEPDSPESTNTQDELDHQLTSSLYEARSASTPVPASSSSAQRPTFKIGASLSSLNSNKPILGSSSTSKNLGARGSQRVLNQDDDEEESEEESEEYSSSSSAEEDSKPKKTSISKPRKKLESSSTSEDDSSSTSESESEDEEKTLRDELAAQIAGLGNGDSQGRSNTGLLSPKAYRSASQQSRSAEKKKGKYLSGYSFSQPV